MVVGGGRQTALDSKQMCLPSTDNLTHFTEGSGDFFVKLVFMEGKLYFQFLYNASIVLLKRVEDVALPIFLGRATLTLCFWAKHPLKPSRHLSSRQAFRSQQPVD